MWARRAEAGPRAGHGSGRCSLQVPSKCFEKNATGHRNPSKVTERSLNILLLDNLVDIFLPNWNIPTKLVGIFQIFMNSDYFVCWG